jgi:hypothetical protein
MNYLLPILTLWVGVVIGATAYVILYAPDKHLDACAREHNVYSCEWVPQPMNGKLLPPPANEGEVK